MNMKMADAVALAKISGTTQVDEALGAAATYGRFATGDLASNLAAGALRTTTHKADEATSLAQGTSGWAMIGQPVIPIIEVVAVDDTADNDLEETV